MWQQFSHGIDLLCLRAKSIEVHHRLAGKNFVAVLNDKWINSILTKDEQIRACPSFFQSPKSLLIIKLELRALEHHDLHFVGYGRTNFHGTPWPGQNHLARNNDEGVGLTFDDISSTFGKTASNFHIKEALNLHHFCCIFLFAFWGMNKNFTNSTQSPMSANPSSSSESKNILAWSVVCRRISNFSQRHRTPAPAL